MSSAGADTTAFHDLDIRESARLGNVFHFQCTAARNLVPTSVKCGTLSKLGSEKTGVRGVSNGVRRVPRAHAHPRVGVLPMLVLHVQTHAVLARHVWVSRGGHRSWGHSGGVWSRAGQLSFDSPRTPARRQ